MNNLQSNEPNPPSGSIWTKPWPRRSALWARLGSVALALFVIVFGPGALAGEAKDWPGLLLVSLIVSVVGALLAGLLVVCARKVCSWRNLKRTLFALACLVTLVALAYAVENWRGRRAWLAHKAELEAKGEKFDMASLAPVGVPEEKNFALTPFLKAALDYSYGPKGVVWTDTNALARLQNTRHDLGSDRSDREQLVLGSLEKNTFADLTACAQFYRGNTNYPQPTTIGTPAQDIGLALARFDPAFAELRAAATNRPLMRYPIQYDYEPPWAILLPHLAHLKGLTALAQARATAALEAGRTEEAFADLQVGFRISDSLSGEPLLIDHLVRIACLGIDLQTLREGLVRHAWSDAQLEKIGKQLGSLNLLAEYHLAIRGERALSTSGLNWLRRQGLWTNPFDAFDSEPGFAGGKLGFNPFPSGWYYQNMLTISKASQDHLLAAVDDEHRRVNPEACEGGARALGDMSRGPYTIFARMLMPALSNAIRKSARMQTFVDEARIACALERYRLAKGKLPENLEALVPAYLGALPADVIDGKPIRYRLETDGGYLLYSIGWNGQDDGGRQVFEPGKKSAVDITRGDWVWRMPAKLGQPGAGE